MTLPSNQFLIQAPFLITSRKFPVEPGELNTTLSKAWNDLSNTINIREIAHYEKFLTNTGQRWFDDGDPQNKKQAFRRVYTAASILNGVTQIQLDFTVNPTTIFTNLYGIADDGTTAVPLEHINTAAPADSIELQIDRANSRINIITTTANWVNFSALIVLEVILN